LLSAPFVFRVSGVSSPLTHLPIVCSSKIRKSGSPESHWAIRIPGFWRFCKATCKQTNARILKLPIRTALITACFYCRARRGNPHLRTCRWWRRQLSPLWSLPSATQRGSPASPNSLAQLRRSRHLLRTLCIWCKHNGCCFNMTSRSSVWALQLNSLGRESFAPYIVYPTYFHHIIISVQYKPWPKP
jgi:hypothetical protein